MADMDRTSLSRAPSSPARHDVAFLLLPHVHLLDLAGAAQAFYEADRLGGAYAIHHVGVEPAVASAQGLELSALAPLPELTAGDLVVVPGFDSERLDAVEASVPTGWLREAHRSGATVSSVCTGAFALGLAGLLDGRRCTTHWKVVAELARRFPAARVLEDRLFVEDGGVHTSAGVASGIDLALSLIEADHGPLVTARVAREMVVYLRRNGSRGQQSVFLAYRTHLHPGVHRVQDWLVAHPAANPTLAELASVAGMSPRHLTRKFRELTGVSLKEFSHALKLEVARGLLHDPDLTVEAVAHRCGFDDARQLRRLWRRHFDTTPSGWRERELASGA